MKKVIIALTLVLSVLTIQACDDNNGGGSERVTLSCGDVLTTSVVTSDAATSRNLVVTDDVLNCSGTAVTVVGPESLDLNGHTVSCDGSAGSIGIMLSGEGATVKNGTVTNCETGIYAGDDGMHTIRDMLAVDNIGSKEILLNGGIVVDSDNNTLRNVTVTGNNPVGMVLYGNGNEVRDCDVSENLHSGLAILSNSNEVSDCVVNDNNYVNLSMVSVIENELTDRGNNNKVTRVTANRNNSHDGIYVGGDFNMISESQADENEVSGIEISAAGTDNTVFNNSAFNNNQSVQSGDDRGGTDLAQQDPDNCDNTWLGNLFGTSNSECIE